MVTHRQRYREKVSQMVSWGHWFALFNILLSLVIGSRYLFIADWPTTLAGRIYSYVSIIGHFSFLVFATYLLILFPLTFIVGSQRLMRFLSVILATAGMTLLLRAPAGRILIYRLYRLACGVYLGRCQLLSPDHHAAR